MESPAASHGSGIAYTRSSDGETIIRVERVAAQLNSYVQHVGNEPSVGLFYIHDHVRRTLPALHAAQKDMTKRTAGMTELSYDLDLSLEAAADLYLPRAADRVRDLAAQALRKVNADNARVALEKDSLKNALRDALNKRDSIAVAVPSGYGQSTATDNASGVSEPSPEGRETGAAAAENEHKKAVQDTVDTLV